MTEYELIDLLQSAYEKMGQDATIYFTLVSAFLAVAFLVGNKLSLKQLFIVSTLYIFWAIGSINSMYTGMLTAVKFESALEAMDSQYWTNESSTEFWVLGFMLVQVGGILASLYFMWGVRQPLAE